MATRGSAPTNETNAPTDAKSAHPPLEWSPRAAAATAGRTCGHILCLTQNRRWESGQGSGRQGRRHLWCKPSGIQGLATTKALLHFAGRSCCSRTFWLLGHPPCQFLTTCMGCIAPNKWHFGNLQLHRPSKSYPAAPDDTMGLTMSPGCFRISGVNPAMRSS